MDYLARREHGRAELTRKLTKFGFEPDTSDDAIAGLIEDGLQSDQRFVDAFIQSRINQGKGPSRIRVELKERGLNGSDIDNGLTDAGQDWFVLAAEVRRKKFGPGKPADFSTKAKQMRFLQYRGFEQDHIQAAVSQDSD